MIYDINNLITESTSKRIGAVHVHDKSTIRKTEFAPHPSSRSPSWGAGDCLHGLVSRWTLSSHNLWRQDPFPWPLGIGQCHCEVLPDPSHQRPDLRVPAVW